MTDKKQEKTKVERFSLLSMSTDDKSPSAFNPMQTDLPDERYTVFVIMVKKMILCEKKEKKELK